MKVLLAGGGTAGHVNPLLALAEELTTAGDELTAAGDDVEVVVLGTAEGLEADLVPARGFRLEVIPRVPFPRRPNAAAIRFPGEFSRALRRTRDIIIGNAIDVVVGFGGYVATPAYRSANAVGVPTVVHEGNVRPGLANRLGARRAAAVALTFAETPLAAKQGTTVVTGLPMRQRLTAIAHLNAAERAAERTNAAARLGLDPGKPTLLVTGGSLGAQHINEAMAQAAEALTGAGIQVLHAAGRGKVATVSDAAARAGADYHLVEYLDDMAGAYCVADLVIGRAGAGTVCEQSALGLPGIYVPLPYGNGEQRLNAAGLVKAGGGILIDDADFTGSVVSSDVLNLMRDADARASMAAAARSHGVRDGAARLAEVVRQVVAKGAAP